MGADPSDAYKADRANYLKAFGKNIRALREEVRPRLSQEHLAEIAGVHRTEIGKIEQGRVNPRLMTLHLVAHALNATLDDLAKELPVPPQRDLWGHYGPGKSISPVDRGPETDGRQSRKDRAK
jgi:DNA-binding XRE family transcriptional regulator